MPKPAAQLATRRELPRPLVQVRLLARNSPRPDPGWSGGSRDPPPLVKAQILAFMRIEWTGGYGGEQQFRDEVWPEGEADNTVHFVLEARGFVIS
jgi:hypothetical protein